MTHRVSVRRHTVPCRSGRWYAVCLDHWCIWDGHGPNWRTVFTKAFHHSTFALPAKELK